MKSARTSLLLAAAPDCCQAGTSAWDSHWWLFTVIAPGQLCWAFEPPEAVMESHWIIWIQTLTSKLPTLESYGKKHCLTLILSQTQEYQQVKLACLSFTISLLLCGHRKSAGHTGCPLPQQFTLLICHRENILDFELNTNITLLYLIKILLPNLW